MGNNSLVTIIEFLSANIRMYVIMSAGIENVIVLG